MPKQLRFGLFPVRSPLLRESLFCFLFLRVLRCFSSPGSLPDCYVRVSRLQRDGLPHSEIRGYIGYLLLPAAYRSLSRPSSPLRAKAFTIRSFLLFSNIILLTFHNCQYVKEPLSTVALAKVDCSTRFASCFDEQTAFAEASAADGGE